MARHFRWILTCIDDGETYELENDPVGFDECVFRMERHSVYKGIFNQFTSPVKFHNNGGGKQFIDLKYSRYDINGQIQIEVLVDSNGRGIAYETIFTGKINLASYQEDGIFTTCNIEQSDLAAKLNTRADIPVPINVPVIEVSGQPSFQAILLDKYRPEDNNDVTSGAYIFNHPNIIKDQVIRVITADLFNNPVQDNVTFTAGGVQGAGGSSGTTTLQITDVEDGLVEVTFANIGDAISLYLVGQQISLGQVPLMPVKTIPVKLDGIPILYESVARMDGDINSGTYPFTNAQILPGHTISVFATSRSGNEISDTVIYRGANTPGNGGYIDDSTIRIISIIDGGATVEYANIDGPIDLWIDGDAVATHTPFTNSSTQLQQVKNVEITSGFVYKGYNTFAASPVFENMGDFVYAPENDIGMPGHDVTNTAIMPVFDGFTEPYIDYPVTVEYRVRLKGNFTNSLDNGSTSVSRFIQGGMGMAHGPSIDAAKGGTVIPLHSFGGRTTGALSETLPFDITKSGSFTLERGDKIWLYNFYFTEFLAGVGGVNHIIDLQFDFEISSIEFRLTVNALPTRANTVAIHEAFAQVTDMLADTNNNFYSEFYGRTDSEKRTYGQNGEGSARLITNGLCIRGNGDRYIETSLDALFRSMQAIDNIGMEIDSSNRLRVEKLEHFFDKTTKIAELDRVYSYVTSNENSYYVNQVETGYNKWETEIYFRNGLDEVHGKRRYGTKVATAKGTTLQGNSGSLLELNTDLIAGNYAIELTRRKNKEWSTDDFKYDNDNFILCATKRLKIEAAFNTPSTITLYDYELSSALLPGDTFTVSNSRNPANDTTFTVSSVKVDAVNNTTVITTVEVVTAALRGNCIINLPRFVPERANQFLNGDISYVSRPGFAQRWLNMRITPARMLQANASRITACMQKIKGDIRFLNGEGNYRAVTKYINEGTGRQEDYSYFALGENSSLNYADSNTRNISPLWVPEIYRFEYPLTYTQFKAIRANPNGYIEFWKLENRKKKGFIISMEYSLKTGIAKFELLKVFDPYILLQEANDAIVADEELRLIVSTGDLMWADIKKLE